jgi:hypothetical protein
MSCRAFTVSVGCEKRFAKSRTQASEWTSLPRHWGLSPWFPRLCATEAKNRVNHHDKRGGGELFSPDGLSVTGDNHQVRPTL